MSLPVCEKFFFVKKVEISRKSTYRAWTGSPKCACAEMHAVFVNAIGLFTNARTLCADCVLQKIPVHDMHFALPGILWNPVARLRDPPWFHFTKWAYGFRAIYIVNPWKFFFICVFFLRSSPEPYRPLCAQQSSALKIVRITDFTAFDYFFHEKMYPICETLLLLPTRSRKAFMTWKFCHICTKNKQCFCERHGAWCCANGDSPFAHR